MTAPLSIEYRLLLCSGRTGLGLGAEDDLRALLQTRFDWPVFARLLQRHQLVPPLFATLQRLGHDAMPAPVRHTLQTQVQHNMQRSLRLAADLVRLIQRLQANGIRALPLKGPTLARRAYGNLALRHAGDLDLLVPGQTLSQTIRILQECGYHCVQERERACNAAQQAAYRRYNNELTFRCDSRTISVDLHWAFDRIQQRFPTHIDALGDRLTWLEFAGTAVPCLQDEDLVLYLCVHGSKHAWMRLFWFSMRLPVRWMQPTNSASTTPWRRCMDNSPSS